jgi:hypothetical protein
MFLITSDSKSKIISPKIINQMMKFLSNENIRIKNLVTIFLSNYKASEMESVEETNSHINSS